MVTESDTLRHELAALHESYVQQLNAALEEGRNAVASELSEAYMDEALALILGQDPVRAAGRARGMRQAHARRAPLRLTRRSRR